MKKLIASAVFALVAMTAAGFIGGQVYSSVKWQQSAPTAEIVPELTDEEYDIIDSMFWEAMRSEELRNDFVKAFPQEAAQVLSEGDCHDCVECRLKGIASAYYDGCFADMFDEGNDESVAYKFNQVLAHNPQIGETFGNIVEYVWGE